MGGGVQWVGVGAPCIWPSSPSLQALYKELCESQSRCAPRPLTPPPLAAPQLIHLLYSSVSKYLYVCTCMNVSVLICIHVPVANALLLVSGTVALTLQDSDNCHQGYCRAHTQVSKKLEMRSAM